MIIFVPKLYLVLLTKDKFMNIVYVDNFFYKMVNIHVEVKGISSVYVLYTCLKYPS